MAIIVRAATPAFAAMHNVAETLAAWNSFYVMIGSAAAALTGLMFVVITLARDQEQGVSGRGIATYSTPTVVHFSCALFAAALMSAPFRSFEPLAISFGLSGSAAAIYVVRVAVEQTRLETYQPDAEDWAWHVGLPIAAYLTLLCGGVALEFSPTAALFAPAAAVTLLIFIGIHNAWDVVTFMAIKQSENPDKPD